MIFHNKKENEYINYTPDKYFTIVFTLISFLKRRMLKVSPCRVHMCAGMKGEASQWEELAAPDRNVTITTNLGA